MHADAGTFDLVYCQGSCRCLRINTCFTGGDADLTVGGVTIPASQAIPLLNPTLNLGLTTFSVVKVLAFYPRANFVEHLAVRQPVELLAVTLARACMP